MTVLGIHPPGAGIPGGAPQHLLGLPGGETGGQDEGGGAGHVGRGHGGALVQAGPEAAELDGLLHDAVGIAVPVQIHVHLAAGGGQGHLGPGVGVGREAAIPTVGGHGDHPGLGGREHDASHPVVAGGRHHHHVAIEGVGHGPGEGAAAAGAAQGEVEHVGAGIHRGHDAPGDGDGAAAPGPEHPHRQDGRVGGHAGRAHAVVGGLGDGAGHVGAVPHIVPGPIVAVHEVEAGPQIVEAVGPARGDARVQDRHHHAGTGGPGPGARRADGVQVPLEVVEGVVGAGQRHGHEVGLGLGHPRIVPEGHHPGRQPVVGHRQADRAHLGRHLEHLETPLGGQGVRPIGIVQHHHHLPLPVGRLEARGRGGEAVGIQAREAVLDGAGGQEQREGQDGAHGTSGSAAHRG